MEPNSCTFAIISSRSAFGYNENKESVRVLGGRFVFLYSFPGCSIIEHEHIWKQTLSLRLQASARDAPSQVLNQKQEWLRMTVRGSRIFHRLMHEATFHGLPGQIYVITSNHCFRKDLYDLLCKFFSETTCDCQTAWNGMECIEWMTYLNTVGSERGYSRWYRCIGAPHVSMQCTNLMWVFVSIFSRCFRSPFSGILGPIQQTWRAKKTGHLWDSLAVCAPIDQFSLPSSFSYSLGSLRLLQFLCLDGFPFAQSGWLLSPGLLRLTFNMQCKAQLMWAHVGSHLDWLGGWRERGANPERDSKTPFVLILCVEQKRCGTQTQTTFRIVHTSEAKSIKTQTGPPQTIYSKHICS